MYLDLQILKSLTDHDAYCGYDQICENMGLNIYSGILIVSVLVFTFWIGYKIRKLEDYK